MYVNSLNLSNVNIFELLVYHQIQICIFYVNIYLYIKYVINAYFNKHVHYNGIKNLSVQPFTSSYWTHIYFISKELYCCLTRSASARLQNVDSSPYTVKTTTIKGLVVCNRLNLKPLNLWTIRPKVVFIQSPLRYE